MVDSSSKKRTVFFKLSKLDQDEPVLSERDNQGFERPFDPALDDGSNTFVGFIESQADEDKTAQIYVSRSDITLSTEVEPQ
jgi:hypothetical protein